MAKRPSYSVTVQSKRLVTTNVVEVVLHGPALSEFPDDFEGGYVKLVLPVERPNGETAVARRSYSVRTFNRETLSLALEFAEHDANGPAIDWLREAQVGTVVEIVGPGPVKRLDVTRDWFLIAGDLTALPAIAVNLERLPDDAVGACLIQIPHADDERPLKAPSGVEIDWIVGDGSVLPEGLRAVRWQDGAVSAWVACEFSDMRQIRTYLCDERGLTNDDMYISSYWKRGSTDEEHKAAKRAAADAG